MISLLYYQLSHHENVIEVLWRNFSTSICNFSYFDKINNSDRDNELILYILKFIIEGFFLHEVDSISLIIIAILNPS